MNIKSANDPTTEAADENVDDLKRALRGSLVSHREASFAVVGEAEQLARSARRSSSRLQAAPTAPPSPQQPRTDGDPTGDLTKRFAALKVPA